MNLPSILSTIVNSPQLDVSQVDNGQQSNSGMSFDQQLAAQTEKLNQQASTIQTSESKSTDTNQAQSQDSKLTAKAANDAEKIAKENQDGGIAGEANYYKATIAWLKKDYATVEKYINDQYVKKIGNDEVLKRLLKNKDKSYKEAYYKK